MLCQIEVLTVPTADTAAEPVIVVSYDDRKYMFNCGEGTQRYMLAAKIPARRIKEVFLTSGWRSHGGLAGLLLSITSQNGRQAVGLHGPKNLAYYMASLRAGQERDWRTGATMQMTIQEYETPLPPMFEDKNITIQPVLALSDKQVPDIVKLKASEADTQRVRQIARTVWSGEFLERDTQGAWTAIQLDRNSNVSAEKTPSRKRSFSTLESPSTGDTDKPEQLHASKFRPSSDQFRAFQTFMLEDLPDGFEPYSAAASYFI